MGITMHCMLRRRDTINSNIGPQQSDSIMPSEMISRLSGWTAYKHFYLHLLLGSQYSASTHEDHQISCPRRRV